MKSHSNALNRCDSNSGQNLENSGCDRYFLSDDILLLIDMELGFPHLLRNLRNFSKHLTDKIRALPSRIQQLLRRFRRKISSGSRNKRRYRRSMEEIWGRECDSDVWTTDSSGFISGTELEVILPQFKDLEDEVNSLDQERDTTGQPLQTGPTLLFQY